mmetsp:Transcript_4355/g.7420  ORF Transcript_4355/g.7420 Transcript_4355/m.7420 type:complete len:322 (+) Transcript_4355:385-1350(+)
MNFSTLINHNNIAVRVPPFSAKHLKVLLDPFTAIRPQQHIGHRIIDGLIDKRIEILHLLLSDNVIFNIAIFLFIFFLVLFVHCDRNRTWFQHQRLLVATHFIQIQVFYLRLLWKRKRRPATHAALRCKISDGFGQFLIRRVEVGIIVIVAIVFVIIIAVQQIGGGSRPETVLRHLVLGHEIDIHGARRCHAHRATASPRILDIGAIQRVHSAAQIHRHLRQHLVFVAVPSVVVRLRVVVRVIPNVLFLLAALFRQFATVLPVQVWLTFIDKVRQVRRTCFGQIQHGQHVEIAGTHAQIHNLVVIASRSVVEQQQRSRQRFG